MNHQEEYKDEVNQNDISYHSPTFAKKGQLITPQKVGGMHLHNTVKKEGEGLIKSPVTFMSQRK
jgi:hypothetical protein